MDFETVERCGRTHVVVNGVESPTFVRPSGTGLWLVRAPHTDYIADTWDEAVNLIAEDMRIWYTILQAAERLVELGAFDEAPSAQSVGSWARDGLFPGAVKIQGKGGRGSGGSWRIPGAGLMKFAAERRKEQ